MRSQKLLFGVIFHVFPYFFFFDKKKEKKKIGKNVMGRYLGRALSTRYLFYLQIINFSIKINKIEESHTSNSFTASTKGVEDGILRAFFSARG